MKENVPLDDPDVEANQEQTMWGEPQEGDAEMECDIDVDNFNSDTDDYLLYCIIPFKLVQESD